MREFAVPAAVKVEPDLNITDLLERQVAEDPGNVLFGRQLTPGQWTDVTAAEFRDDVVSLAKGLIAKGIQPGERVAIMAATRYEWTLLDFAIWYAGAVTVPIYETSSPSQIAWIVQDSEVKLVFAETDSHVKAVDRAVAQEKLESVQDVLTIDSDDLDQLRSAGKEIADEELQARRSAANLEDLATIIYTSGTTGKPKGCELTHGNFAELSLNALASLETAINKNSSTVLFIPLAHVFARFISVISVAAGARVGHTSDIKQLVDDLGTFQPSFLLAVPRVFEKIYNAAMMKAEADGKGSIFQKAAQTAIDYAKASQEGKPGFVLKLKHGLFDKLVYSKLRARMGGNVKFAVSGGSPLGARLGFFFKGIGLHVMEGYGLTETTAPLTVNTPTATKIGSVGQPLPGHEVRIDDSGEILGRGVGVFRGYLNRPDANQESFTEDGWYRTGDVGALDSEGFLTITGRQKEILVTAAGKNVAPAQLEDQIRADAIVSQAVVVGDGRPFVAALITLDAETLPGWLEGRGMNPDTPVSELIENQTIIDHVQSVVDKANQSVSKAESIRTFKLLEGDFTIESGHLTPSMKIRRADIMKDYAEAVETLYAEAAQARAAQA
ncbi:AMP-dependent synthetase/ligase [Nesterenkonia alkaliphila]|uniref:AMP-binding protein n=1 Tax=Nesterenkonia alkaliphila TaxID=1463631 RepID=A0A7K1UGB3_9MICC|nr:AMP-dependent synthetase/ligase [Nesterenkonia alkaliphila]MVT25434.1 AMP-binding protein [Nesterenkonia alkaliphila]GFZ83964.1 long-chain-fatty-acid--CoA ligase [Nesterenkonia alkaliphila]